MTAPSHPPAVKVAGRRLSMTKPRPSHPHTSTTPPPAEAEERGAPGTSPIDDYPRPLSSAQAAERHTSTSSLDYQPVDGVRSSDASRAKTMQAKNMQEDYSDVLPYKGQSRGVRIDQPASRALDV